MIIVGLYLLAAALGWQIKEWLKVPVTVSMFIALGSGAAIGGVLRGHLVFTELVNERNLAVERRRTARAQLVVDLFMACALIVDAGMLIIWPLTAVLIIALGIGIGLAALVLEPAAMKARLGEVD